jgi:hypothetical protein
MSELIVIRDAFLGEREVADLHCGESLAANLRRLFPRGISGQWRIYLDSVIPGNEIAATELTTRQVLTFQTYILVRTPGANPLVFFWQMFIAIALQIAAKMLQPKPRHRERAPQEQDDRSGNNVLAGQSNRLRLGGRVPDIMGTVRSYPDLLCNPIETWWQTTQNLQQYFVIGKGYYDVLPGTIKLGNTPFSDIAGSAFTKFEPGALIEQMPMVQRSAEVMGVSLMPEDGGSFEATNVVFNAAAKTMTSDEFLDIPQDSPITVNGTNFNNGDKWCLTSPAAGSAAPFVYQLDGPVVNETGANALITPYATALQMETSTYYGTSSLWPPTPTAQDARFIMDIPGLRVGDKVRLRKVISGTIARGVVSYRQAVVVAVLPVTRIDEIIRVTDPNGAVYSFTAASETTEVRKYTPGDPISGGGGGGTPAPGEPVPTNWFTAPMENPREIWVDIAFPSGLARFNSGNRLGISIDVRVEFRRQGATDPQATRTYTYNGNTTGPLRFTQRISVDTLGLPAGSPWIQVRLTKMTTFEPDDATNQYYQDTFFDRLSAMRYLPAHSYPDVTVCVIALSNTRNAVSMGETSVNMVVTRRLPTWTGSAWTAMAATDRWADNFVERCKATDGANKTDAQIDLAGIYALQAQLNALDESSPGAGDGMQGRISMTLDQQTDIDSELATLADVVRAVVYRVGKKIYVTRDQATATRIALFNGRTKNPEAESTSMRMTNDGENDSVTVAWFDSINGFRLREWTFPEPPTVISRNPLKLGTPLANWPQAYRRALFEWYRLRLRREQISVNVTEDGRIVRPGDVVNITDDIANLASAAGEILYISGNVLTLDRDVTFTAGHSHSVLVRDLEGQDVDTIPVTAVAGSPNKVQLSRAPVSTVVLKPRDTAMGSLYAFFDDALATVRPWIITSVSVQGPYVQLQGQNYNADVYQGDTGTVPALPILPSALRIEDTL